MVCLVTWIHLSLTCKSGSNSYGLPKKRCMPQCHRASSLLSSPQLEMPREETKRMPYGIYPCNRSQKNNVRSEDIGIEMDFSYLPDNSLAFSSRSLPECNAPILQESSNYLGVHTSYLALETKYIGEMSDKHMDHLSDAKWYSNSLQTDCSINNTIVVKEPSVVPLYLDNDREKVDHDLMKPFMRSCSSRLDQSPIVGSKRGDNKSRFQADDFRKWLHMDERFDNRETDYVTLGSEPWLDDTTGVCLPTRITTDCNLDTDYFLSEEPFDSPLTCGDCSTEDSSYWECSKSSHWSSKSDWSASMFGEKLHVEPLTDVVVSKRDFKHCRDDVFDLSADEGENIIFNFDNMRDSSSREDCSLSGDMLTPSFLKGDVNCKMNFRNIQNGSILFPQPWDFLYEAGWRRSKSCGKHETCIPVSHHMSSLSYAEEGKSKIAQCRFHGKQPRRSCSAPPFYRGKKKFVALNSWMTVESRKSRNEKLRNPPTQEASNLKHVQRSSGVALTLEEGFANDLHSEARDHKKKIIESEISDYEGEAAHCLDVYNTDSDFTSKEDQGALDFGGKWRNDCPWTSNMEKPGNFINQDSILDISSGILHLSGDSLLPKSISKKCLEDSKVLQQVDKKFIPVVGGGILAIIDQHAADERIRLEDLRAKVLSGKMKTTTYLDAEQELVLPEIGFQLLNNYSDQIQKWGWICNFHAQSSVSFKRNLKFLHNQPSVAKLIAVPCILGVNLTDVDLLEFLQQLADTDGSSPIPPAVLRVLNFKACRGAIMFGDALLPSECSLIVEELKQTSLCFQCAHGRPTTAPLVNLVVLHKQIAKLGNLSGGSSGPWHGLSRHRPSLEHAIQRLSSEGGQC